MATQCIYVFYVDLRRNSDYFPTLPSLIVINETEYGYRVV